MQAHPSTWLLVGFLLLFALFLVLRSAGIWAGNWLPAGRRHHPAWRRLDEQRRAAKQAEQPTQAAEHWRMAATVALEELERPDLAANLAWQAEQADPQHETTWPLLARALRRASRHRALEKLLWRQLANRPAESAAYDQAFSELVSLYEGPLHRPERALVLRRLQSAAQSKP